MPDKHLSDLRFDQLELTPPVLEGLRDAGFENCTPIQANTLPIALGGTDVAGQAQTGTGKTAAFLVALFNHLLLNAPAETRKPQQVRAMVLAPTRELAVQIHADAEVLGAHTGLTLGLAFGGTDYEKQRRRLEEGVDILIGTPGRIIDYFKQRVFDLTHAQVLVLDEADRMFDIGFIKDIRYLLRKLPPHDERLNLLFSATLGHRVLELAYEHMNDPQLVRVEPDKITADRVRQVVYFPANQEKLPLLVGMLRRMDPPRTMVFVNTKRSADLVQRTLEVNGVSAQAISGDVPQRKRLSMLKAFQSGELRVLVGTDVASRGLHIPGVTHVINYDLPQDAEDYVHRIGRTARAGEFGDAISFGCEDYAVNLPDIEAYIGRRIPVDAVPQEDLAEVKRAPRRPPRNREEREGRRGGRGDGGGRSRRGSRSRSDARDNADKEPQDASTGAPENGAASDSAPAEAAATGDGAKKKRRRRRRRSGPRQDEGTNASKDASSSSPASDAPAPEASET
ncbi:MAG: DEAD/DEAH box helicase [Pseudomonadota bacterium]